MKNTVDQTISNVEAAPKAHPLTKSYMIVSTRHIDLNNLDAFEAISMSAVFMLAITLGVTYSQILFS